MQEHLSGKTALVLGAGGVGKAITYGLLRRDMRVVVTDGNVQQAQTLAQQFDCKTASWAERHNVNAELVVNCTPVGMHPNVDASPYDKHYLRPPMVVFDVVYNPENTLLVKEARSRNCIVITGVDMFVRQACLQFQHFAGMEGPAELMRETIRHSIGAARSDGLANNDAPSAS
jgi:3-dehydroquinate dehydratase / shikimate dehydrogenase